MLYGVKQFGKHRKLLYCLNNCSKTLVVVLKLVPFFIDRIRTSCLYVEPEICIISGYPSQLFDKVILCVRKENYYSLFDLFLFFLLLFFLSFVCPWVLSVQKIKNEVFC